MKQTCGLTQVMGLIGHQAEIDEVTERICERECFGRYTSARTSNGLARAVKLDDGAVGHGVVQVGIQGQCFEHVMENIRFDPSVEPLEHAVPFAKLIG